MIDLDIVDELLGVPPGYPTWRVADMARRARVLPTWLSSAEARGQDLSPAAGEHLARARRRVRALHQVGEELSAAHGVRIIKGAKIAAHMPAGLLRDSGDTDVVATDEESLWRCVLDLRERWGAVPQGVNLIGSAESFHIVVAMKWPAEEPELDKPMGADISTCAFSGDLIRVPVRERPPEDEEICSLLAVAEERFQRKFRRKDMLDLVVLADALERRLGGELPGIVAAKARELCLAPELLKLVRKTSEWVALPDSWTATRKLLASAAADEKSRRRGQRTNGRHLRFGFPLDDRACDGLAITFHRFPQFELISTPVGTCLLVADPDISPEVYTAAMGGKSAIHGRCRPVRQPGAGS